MEKIFKEEHQVSYGDCDETGKIQLPHLIELFMQVSNDQLTSGGAGIHDLLKQNLGWGVVSIILILTACLKLVKKLLLLPTVVDIIAFLNTEILV